MDTAGVEPTGGFNRISASSDPTQQRTKNIEIQTVKNLLTSYGIVYLFFGVKGISEAMSRNGPSRNSMGVR
jgi:hypothetical protein